MSFGSKALALQLIKLCWANGFGNLWKESSSREKLLLPSLGKRKGDGVPRK